MSAGTEESVDISVAAPEERLVAVPLAQLAWMLAGAVFVALRLWPVWGTPVGGAELVHLSGAWNAHAGVDDPRYVPTFFQAIVAALFWFTSSEVPARLLALAATATVPLALHTVRHQVGEVASILALLLLTLDAPSLAIGAESGAMGFDLALTVWLFVLAVRGGLPAWALTLAGFLVASGGPLSLPLLAAIAVLTLQSRQSMDYRLCAWLAAGAFAGIAFSTIRPGLGPDGLTIAPVELFAAAYEENWSTADVLALTVLTSWPIVLGGAAGAAWLLSAARGWPHERPQQVLILWAAFSATWFLTSLPSHALVPLAGLTLPAALLCGIGLTHLLQAMGRADWSLAKYLVSAAIAALCIIAFYLGDWAKLDRTGGNEDKVIVTALALGVLAIVGALAADRRTWPALGVLAVPFLAVPLLVGASVVAFRAGDSPAPSPYSTASAGELRDVAVAASALGGDIVLHVDFEKELTWPFRDSGNVVLTSRIPAGAAIVIWPATGPAAMSAPPQGYLEVEEKFALTAQVQPPTRFLKLLRWYTERYSLLNTERQVAVFIRNAQ